jgi:hypothetical protein
VPVLLINLKIAEFYRNLIRFFLFGLDISL